MVSHLQSKTSSHLHVAVFSCYFLGASTKTAARKELYVEWTFRYNYLCFRAV